MRFTAVAVLIVAAFCGSALANTAEVWPDWVTGVKDIPLEYDNYLIYCYKFPNNKKKEYTDEKPIKDLPTGLDCEKLKGVVTKQAWWANADKWIQDPANAELDGATSAKNEAEVEVLEKVDAKSDATKKKFSSRRLSGLLAKGLVPSLLEAESEFEMQNPGPFAPIWPARTVPFCYDVGWNILTRFTLARGMQHLAAATSVRFRSVRCADNGHKIKFVYAQGAASSPVGYRGAQGNTPGHLAGSAALVANAPTEQTIRFDGGIGMFNSYSASHEIIHSLGWAHTQSRSDRDFYVNCVDGGNANYRIWGPPDDLVYDYESVMHYGPKAGGPPSLAALPKPKPGAPHVPLGNPNNIGQRVRISAQDAQMINNAYNGLPLQ